MSLITSVSVGLKDRPMPQGLSGHHVVAFADVVIGGAYEIHHIRIVEGPDGRMFVGSPTVPRTAACAGCEGSVAITHRHCPFCGDPQPHRPAPTDRRGRPRPYSDIFRSLTDAARRELESAVLNAYVQALHEARKAAEAAA